MTELNGIMVTKYQGEADRSRYFDSRDKDKELIRSWGLVEGYHFDNIIIRHYHIWQKWSLKETIRFASQFIFKQITHSIFYYHYYNILRIIFNCFVTAFFKNQGWLPEYFWP